ncbi:MAG: carbohydrate ABC transporter permease [Lentilactobacillus diolivorans]|jgi:sn-glycerol 3-phosphate transport system permease protein|uniref:Sugar ABC superfamily ATP binding cassette transporter, membrane protein n=2 Tax=Lentilactobacillus diolivorans TaxID=179838 RepID=A0A0R1S506_9LACO|nr:carbohydrate ABC transporter permease [Lentilactobacillus diolivorans]RRG03794.1 MAG: carbohydrate ABC transporter permease [Lactobacillus sp.]KRL64063.1 sugar ABC superfamily ATP binding cassette transporter, membrane protein [Lentilactobacillus diolivorans DSM 14421]MCH4165212.1 carbohydrate ABC transporter permease [Lentilactobacillus diolivorans]MDH5105514.1 carbohydrate ABC transporter permease [Lentilactobacillus diolivorans]GEP25141.1 glycerol-3-phosphate ABC transporter permease [Le
MNIVAKPKLSHTILNYILLIVLAAVVLGPFLIGLWTSFLPTMDIAKGNFLSLHLSLQNYIDAFTQTPIIRYLGNSLFISVATMIAQLIFCSMSAYAFVFLKFKYRNFLFGLFLATMMLPFEAEIIPNFTTVKALGLLNTYSVMIIPFLTSAFGTFMLRQSFLQMPAELKEAADIEGLGHFQFYWKIALPYNKISLLTLGAYSFLGAWNQYLWPMLTTFSNAYRPVQNGLRQLQSEETFNDWGMIQATAAIVVIPTLIVLFVGQHYFKSGMNEGAVK